MNNVTKHFQVIILGSGPAGLTAAIYTARAKLTSLLLTGPVFGGQITLSQKIENYPGFPEAITGYELINLFKKQAEKFNTEIFEATATDVSLTEKPFKITVNSGEIYTCDTLVIACGRSKRLFSVQNENELFGYGVSTCATCDGAFYKNLPVCVVGNNDFACSEALFLNKYASEIYFLNPEKKLNISFENTALLKENSKIQILNDTLLTKINGSKEEGVKNIEVKIAGEEKKLICNGVFIATGLTPNSELFKSHLKLDQNGYIVTAAASTATSVPGVFACGEIRAGTVHQVAGAVGDGCLAAYEIEKYLKNKG